jgi:ribonuclease HI
VRGHAGEPMNERVDQLATAAREALAVAVESPGP